MDKEIEICLNIVCVHCISEEKHNCKIGYDHLLKCHYFVPEAPSVLLDNLDRFKSQIDLLLCSNKSGGIRDLF